MAKKSLVQSNARKISKVSKYAERRSEIVKKIRDKNLSMGERFELQYKISMMSQDTAASRVRNRCMITGRPRGYLRKFGLSRIVFREMALSGLLPGVKKSNY